MIYFINNILKLINFSISLVYFFLFMNNLWMVSKKYKTTNKVSVLVQHK